MILRVVLLLSLFTALLTAAVSYLFTCYRLFLSTRKILKFVFTVSILTAVVATAVAAPPRFNRVGSPDDIPDKQQTEASDKNSDQSGLQLTDDKQASTDKGMQPNPVNEATNTEAQKTDKQDVSANQQGHAKSVKDKVQKKRESLFERLFRRKPKKTQENTHKHPDELVNTRDHHQSVTEKIGTANAHRYQPALNAFWKVDSSKVMCSMKQTIANYGHVEFRQGVGQPLEFALFVDRPPAGTGRAHLRIEPPQWQHFARPKDLGVIEMEPGERAVSASEEWSRRLFLDMSDGMQPVLRYWDAADGSDDIEVFLSALNFQNSLDLFNQCVGQLLRYDFKSAKRTVVHFHEDSSKLRAKAMRQLDEVLEILKEDSGIKQVDLELYTHSKGLVRYNFRLATRRARAVRDYFIKRGIDENKLLIKIHTKSRDTLNKLGYKPTDVHIVLQRKVAK